MNSTASNVLLRAFTILCTRSCVLNRKLSIKKRGYSRDLDNFSCKKYSFPLNSIFLPFHFLPVYLFSLSPPLFPFSFLRVHYFFFSLLLFLMTLTIFPHPTGGKWNKRGTNLKEDKKLNKSKRSLSFPFSPYPSLSVSLDISTPTFPHIHSYFNRIKNLRNPSNKKLM